MQPFLEFQILACRVEIAHNLKSNSTIPKPGAEIPNLSKLVQLAEMTN